mmetsp:Transcript_32528/g.64899  ORF Transcript_32528/g.64899 Transcript_32528/m.64899 type:complete len:86 (-) Transcript_32528:63-320(-)
MTRKKKAPVLEQGGVVVSFFVAPNRRVVADQGAGTGSSVMTSSHAGDLGSGLPLHGPWLVGVLDARGLFLSAPGDILQRHLAAPF